MQLDYSHYSINQKVQLLLNQDNTITEQSQLEIQHIMNELTIGKNPNKVEEIERMGGERSYLELPGLFRKSRIELSQK
jgi:hypothetical protein